MALPNQKQKAYVIPKGRVSIAEYVNPDDPRELEGWRYIGNTPGFEINFSSDSTPHIDADSGFEEVDDESISKITEEGTLNVDNINGDNLALFFLGEASILTQDASDTALTEIIGPVKTDLTYLIGRKVVGQSVLNPHGLRGLSDVVVSTIDNTDPENPVAGEALTEGVDYVALPDIGEVMILAGGAIASGDSIWVSYKMTGTEQTQVISARTQRVAAIKFVAHNPKGTNWDFLIPKARFMPDGSFDLKSREWLNMSIKFTILSPGYGMESISMMSRPEVK